MKNKSEIFEQLMADEKYRELLQQLPEDERKLVKQSLQEIVLMFENNLIAPIKNLKK